MPSEGVSGVYPGEQAAFALVGTAIMIFCARVKRAFFYKNTYFWVFLAFALLALAMAWSLWLGWRVSAALPGWRRALPIGALLLGNALIGYGWWLQFWGW